MLINITEHVQGVQYLLQFWRSDGVLNLNTHFYSVVFDLFCIFRENTHEQQLIQAKILYQCPSRNILDFVYGGSHFSTGVIFLRVRHVKNRPLWHFFYTWDTFFYGQGSFLYDEKWPLGRFSTGVVIRRYTGSRNFKPFGHWSWQSWKAPIGTCNFSLVCCETGNRTSDLSLCKPRA